MEYTIYISGKITGENWNECYKKFQYAEDKLREFGIKHLVNPMKLGTDQNTSWEEAMKICLKALSKCSAIFMLDDWKDSKGAREEFEKASLWGKDIFYQEYEDQNEIKMLLSLGIIK